LSRPVAAALVACLATAAAIAPLAGAAAGVSGCGSSADANDAGPRTCLRDLDCGDHRYCSAGSICRTDCFVDTDCLGPTKTAQCNAQGRCVETDLDAMAPDAPEDASADVGGE
jgi:hypothetical protein